MSKMKNLILLSALFAGARLFAGEGYPASNCLWYAQPAVINDAAVPWAEGKTPCGNYGGGGQDELGNNSARYCAPNALAMKCKDPWEAQSLPIGNGRVGGTIFGGDKRDRINLNEISLWTGGPNLPGNGGGYSYGPRSGESEFGSYQPFANFFAEYNLKESTSKTEMYSRALWLKTGVASVEFTNGGVHHTREAFVSHPDDVLVYSAKVDKPGALSACFGLTPCHDVSFSVVGKGTIVMRGKLANGETFEGRMMVRAEGGKIVVGGGDREVKVDYEGNGDGMRPKFEGKGIPFIKVLGANSAEAYITLATDYKEDFKANWKGEDPAKRNEKVLAKVAKKTYAAIRSDHVADHGAFYKRMSISLGKTPAEIAKLPTDLRIAKYRETQNDPELEALVYQYGRYVLIAGSRPGNLPLTLQGIWNDKVHAPWACDYHNNINLQMCYWGAEVANLSECHLTFIDFMKAMEEPLHNMTQKAFGQDKKGWTTRISQNIWGAGGWVKWNPPVNAWYALHVWDHYLFTRDKEYLRNTGYPIMKSICEFWETSLKEIGAEGKGLKTDGGSRDLTAAEYPELKEIKAGSLVSPNGWSHEQGPVEDGCMHDQQLIWELFDNTAKAAKILKVDSEWTKGILEKRDRLVGNRIAKGGYLQEWIVDRPNMVSGHRHTSHLIGVYPGSTISKTKSPEFAAAAAKSLELRGTTGDCRRSWTWPWRTALWARLGNTAAAYEMVQSYIRYNLLDNMFGNHPPMQMDGTYGMTGGMSEMLIQSHAGRIELLPALPAAWKDGYVKGIRSRGNITVDMEWKNGKVTDFKLRTSTPKPKKVTVVVNGETKSVMPKSE